MTKKHKILTLGDHPLSPSGVGTQTRYFIEGLLKTGRYQVFSLGGAIKHENYNAIKTEEWGDDWVIHPIDGYGTKEVVRGILRAEKPDVVWFMTDPRFWRWLWEIENEVRPLCPMVYHHVWDNYPYPMFNKKYYDSNDHIVTISKVTDDLVRTVSPDVPCTRIGHVVPEIFQPYPASEVDKFKSDSLAGTNFPEDRIIFFWNNRNARRKQSGSLIYWFKAFLDKVGHDKALLIMHTDPKDIHGQNLEYLLKNLGMNNGEVMLSTQKIDQKTLAMIYNMADCTINVSDAEGFGLSTMESLACGTPIIVNMTGGLQEQVTDGKSWFGIGMEPTSKAIIGSQDIPMIYEDRLSEEVVVKALVKMFNKTKKQRDAMGARGRKHVMKNYNFDKTMKVWDELMQEIIETNGSWDTRKNYKSWRFERIKVAA